MEKKTLLHIDERQGHVAVDMGLMTKQQVEDVTMEMLLRNATLAEPLAFVQVAVGMGYLDEKSRAAVEAEEMRRRRLITGYEIIDIVGSGTIATVYHAMQLTMDREVALKILHPRLASDPVFVRAYIAEAQAVSRFHHPNIVQGFDAGESNGFYYFAHEYLSGGSIADRLAEGGESARFSESRLLRYLKQTTAALRHAWAVAVYHGDINPGNLLLDAAGTIKLANLGVPRVAGLRSMGKEEGFMPGFVRCGPEYAAPEQLDKPDLVNAQTDMYSLGATFYHLSFGVLPFTAPKDMDLIEYRKQTPTPSFALESQEGFSGKYLRLLHDMLEPDPSRRPANPEELADRLERLHQTEDAIPLGRQSRQISAQPGGAVSARASQRLSKRTVAPSSHSAERTFSLKRRSGLTLFSRAACWLIGGLAAAVAIVVLWVVLFSKG